MNGQGHFLGHILVVEVEFSKWENESYLSVLIKELAPWGISEQMSEVFQFNSGSP